MSKKRDQNKTAWSSNFFIELDFWRSKNCVKACKMARLCQDGHDVQLGGHKFHKNGKNQKKQSVWLFCLKTLT